MLLFQKTAPAKEAAQSDDPFICLCPPLPGHAHQWSLSPHSLSTHPSLEVTVLNQLISSSSCGTQNYTDMRYTEILCKPSAMYQVFYNSRRQVDGKPETQVSATGWARHSAPSLSHQDARCGGNERRARKPPKSGNAGELRLSYTPGVTLWSTVSLPNLLQPPRETQEPHQTKPQSWGKPSREAGWLVSPVSREDPLSEKREKAEHLNS